MPTAIANGLSLPNPLSNGTVADAVPVMADFNYLLAALNRALLDTGGGAGMNAQSTQLHNLANGTAANDAVNLSQLGGYALLAGAAFTGPVSLAGALTAAAITASALITGNAGFAGTTLSLSGGLLAVTPNSGTTGGFRLAANGASGNAIIQFLSNDLTNQLGYIQVSSAGSVFNLTSGSLALPNVTGTPVGSAVGGLGFLGVPPNVYTTSQTVGLAHMGESADFNGVGLTATIASGLPNGWATLITNVNASPLTIASAVDTMYLSGTTTTGSRTLGQNGVVGVRRVNGVLIIGGTALS